MATGAGRSTGDPWESTDGRGHRQNAILCRL